MLQVPVGLSKAVLDALKEHRAGIQRKGEKECTLILLYAEILQQWTAQLEGNCHTLSRHWSVLWETVLIFFRSIILQRGPCVQLSWLQCFQYLVLETVFECFPFCDIGYCLYFLAAKLRETVLIPQHSPLRLPIYFLRLSSSTCCL